MENTFVGRGADIPVPVPLALRTSPAVLWAIKRAPHPKGGTTAVPLTFRWCGRNAKAAPHRDKTLLVVCLP